MAEELKVKIVQLPMGGVYASNRPVKVSTLLGSCVATCLFDPAARVGGMNHILLPGSMQSGDEGLATRYGVHAMETLIRKILKLGGHKEALRAKLFGGARMLGLSSGMLDVSEMNCAFTLEFLKDAGIPIDAYQLGGTRAMTVCFDVGSGKALVRSIPKPQAMEVVLHEQAYETRIYRAAKKSTERDGTA